MLFPMGMGGDTSEPPTEWALSMRKWVICLWIVLLILFVAKCVVLDLFGAFSMIIIVGLGYFVPWGKPPMQQRWIIFWGIMCAFNFFIDLIFAVMHLVQYLNGTHQHPLSGSQHRYHDPDRKLTPMEEYMVTVALPSVIIGLCVPFVELIIAWVCYKLYQDHPRSALADPYGSYGSGYGSAGYGGGGPYGSSGGGGGGSVYQGGNRPGHGSGGQGFQAFQGGGHRLGGGR
eukprot:gnl/MRDRNA2_/MRDRNA2_109367_c0_seq1.p1 gnl/MRDRNA2_/MRDRNA2_109367_c0~~gnl/MRDRNA2_/MRDRNA2_109367_c0_seq1.p1  ORF type:complete len:230 (-),score=24.91 gnl/MRDRNA2_/MRDRNA2_109367_c0_seq1:42-731(-)